MALGLTFRETMTGWFALGETDPRSGSKRGKHEGIQLSISPIVTINDLDEFICNEHHIGTLCTEVHFPLLFPGPVTSEDGRFNLFVRIGNTRRKMMLYELSFEFGGKNYYLTGHKEIENDPGFDLLKDTTTLFTILHEGSDKRGPVIGAGILRITFPEFVKQLLSMRIIGAKSFREKLQALAVFLQFFLVELSETYWTR